MKTFKEFQTESYSRLDENKLATDILSRGFRAFTGKEIYDTLGPDAGNSLPGKDGKKVKNRKTNTKGEVASTAIGAFSDKIVKGGWKYGVKPGWNRVAKPALTGAYNVAKFGVNKVALPATAWAFKQVFGGGVDRI